MRSLGDSMQGTIRSLFQMRRQAQFDPSFWEIAGKNRPRLAVRTADENASIMGKGKWF